MVNAPNAGWTDDLLIREIRAGGQRRNTAWQYIYKAWRGYYIAPVLRDGGTPEQVDEVLGQVVMDVEKQVVKEEFTLQTAKLQVYFTESVKRAWSRAREHAARTQTVDLDQQQYDPGQTDSVEQEYLRQEAINRLDALLSRLGEQCKTVLMRFARGYSMREIADELGFENEQSAKNAKSRCHKNLLELTKNL